jgi:ankyrin repeat protein
MWQVRHTVLACLLAATASVRAAPVEGDPLEELVSAIHRDDLVVVRQIATAHPGLVEAQSESGSPLRLALRGDDIPIAEALWAAGPKQDVIGAAALGDTQVVSELVAEEPARARESTGFWSWRPLHWACRYGHRETASVLLDIDGAFAGDAHGRTPLHVAAEHDQAAVVRLLVDHGIDVDVQDDKGQTPLFYAAFGQCADVVSSLLAKGADPRHRAGGNGTALHAAAHVGDAQIVRLLLRSGADANATDNWGKGPLSYAMENGRNEAADVLLSAGAEHDVFTAAGLGDWMALVHILGSDPEKVNALDAGGVHVDGRTPLHWAARWGHGQCINWLLVCGASVDVREAEGRTPLHLAALCTDDPNIIRELALADADVDARDTLKSATPLAYAASHGHRDAAWALICQGASILKTNHAWDTPLELAVLGGHTDTCELLLKAGARADWVGFYGRTPLHAAACSGDLGTMELLLARGADAAARDDGNATPLHDAAYDHDNVEVARLLVEAGGPLDVRDARGRTPIEAARASHHRAVAAFLEQYAAAQSLEDGDGSAD